MSESALAMLREDEVRRRSVKGAIRIRSAEGCGVTDTTGDARRLAQEAARRALEVVSR